MFRGYLHQVKANTDIVPLIIVIRKFMLLSIIQS